MDKNVSSMHSVSGNDIAVTVYCTAYNHEPYIAEALDSFVNQKTGFKFEVLVTDDASTDGTTAIIASYAEKYPDIIRFFHQDENRFSKGGNLYEEVMYPNTRGRYVAYCEGDDFWNDTDKLRQQVDFLDSNPDYSACVHNSCYRFCDSSREDEPVIPFRGDRDVPFSEVITGMSRCFHTSSILARAELLTSPPDFQRVAYREGGFTDYPNAINFCLNGKVRFIDKPMSVYRVNSNPDSWQSGVRESYSKKIRFVKAEIAMMQALIPHVSGENLRLTEAELHKRRYELLYLEGNVKEMMQPPYRDLFSKEPVGFKAKTLVKRFLPRLHNIYRNSKNYK